jgi:hypothetical protein
VAVQAKLVVGIGGVCGAGLAALGGGRRDPHQAVRILKRQRPQQQRIHHAEHCNVCPDPQRQNQHSDKCKSAIAPQRAKGVLQILQKNVEFHKSSRLALLVFRRVHPAKPHQRLAPRFRRAHAPPPILFRGQRNVLGYLCFEIRVKPAL